MKIRDNYKKINPLKRINKFLTFLNNLKLLQALVFIKTINNN